MRSGQSLAHRIESSPIGGHLCARAESVIRTSISDVDPGSELQRRGAFAWAYARDREPCLFQSRPFARGGPTSKAMFPWVDLRLTADEEFGNGDSILFEAVRDCLGLAMIVLRTALVSIAIALEG